MRSYATSSEGPGEHHAGADRAQVAAIWKLDVPLRDKAPWRMLYETAARAEEILALDVPDLDLTGKRGCIISKGGTTDWTTGRPAPRCCCPGCWPCGARARCS